MMTKENTQPRLTIGLPVYNGESYLAEALDSLLAQTFTEFEIVISDNGSTDRTEQICRDYVSRDRRVSYHRQPVNLGGAGNHDFLVRQAKYEYFKWASDDDLYEPEYLARCIALLDSDPSLVLAHCPTTFLDADGKAGQPLPYQLESHSADPVVRFHSLLSEQGGDDVYGIMRREAIQAVAPHNSYHYAERPLMCELVLHGKFGHAPEHMYYRRDHPGRGERASSVRDRCVRDDPRRADKWRHPVIRLYGEYVLGLVNAIRRAPVSTATRMRCYTTLVRWLLSHTSRNRRELQLSSPDPAIRARAEGIH